MLRIRISDEGDSTSFAIEGKLTAPRLALELEGVWQAALERQLSKPIVVKLAAVTFVDAEGRDLLARMRRQEVKLIPTGCLMKAIVEQIEAEMPAGLSDL